MQFSKRYQEIVERVHADICSNLQPGQSVQAMAQIHGIPKNALNFYFTKVYGISIYQLKLRVTMSYARKKILNGQSIQDLQEELGYRSPKHFDTVYQSVYQELPSRTLEARQKHVLRMLQKLLCFWYHQIKKERRRVPLIG
ncbi:helix-turn-helix domain-containing protein [Chitinophaga rhizophila]|uniref:AraC family transcriptional regulator n=1 Tax=Chitinophaga rhizophila TaxID=2866212 RepID=A0ABS7GIY9_9BACT|nr:AraC family transcriptional regulator [Chitinophaga rhizophila]MBW8687271.1 AraC family transcriptional regulator [Chitinophaga rhizophila]